MDGHWNDWQATQRGSYRLKSQNNVAFGMGPFCLLIPEAKLWVSQRGQKATVNSSPGTTALILSGLSSQCWRGTHVESRIPLCSACALWQSLAVLLTCQCNIKRRDSFQMDMLVSTRHRTWFRKRGERVDEYQEILRDRLLLWFPQERAKEDTASSLSCSARE